MRLPHGYRAPPPRAGGADVAACSGRVAQVKKERRRRRRRRRWWRRGSPWRSSRRPRRRRSAATELARNSRMRPSAKGRWGRWKGTRTRTRCPLSASSRTKRLCTRARWEVFGGRTTRRCTGGWGCSQENVRKRRRSGEGDLLSAAGVFGKVWSVEETRERRVFVPGKHRPPPFFWGRAGARVRFSHVWNGGACQGASAARPRRTVQRNDGEEAKQEHGGDRPRVGPVHEDEGGGVGRSGVDHLVCSCPYFPLPPLFFSRVTRPSRPPARSSRKARRGRPWRASWRRPTEEQRRASTARGGQWTRSSARWRRGGERREGEGGGGAGAAAAADGAGGAVPCAASRRRPCTPRASPPRRPTRAGAPRRAATGA